MRRHRLLGIVAAASFSLSTQAPAQTAPPPVSEPEHDTTKSAAYRWEAAYLTLSAIDGIQTIDCVHRHVCSEGSPIWGKHPSTAKVVLGKLGIGLVHFGLFKLITDRDPKTGLRAAQVSAVVQGGVVLLNARWTFK